MSNNEFDKYLNDIKTLQKENEELKAQLEVLTKCETLGHCYPQLDRECSACKNKKKLSEVKGE